MILLGLETGAVKATISPFIGKNNKPGPIPGIDSPTSDHEGRQEGGRRPKFNYSVYL